MELEVCANGLQSAFNAAEGGADRIELCVALENGGLTPSLGLIEIAVKRLNIPVHVLIRPKAGNFIYTDPEKEIILRDIIFCKESGAAGVVIGALLPNNSLDLVFLKKCITVAGKMEKTFHRAMDIIKRSDEELSQIITLGFNRILTSGGQNSAEEGIEEISRICEIIGDKIEVMAGAGITPANISKFMEINGLSAVHGSAKSQVSPSNTPVYSNEAITETGIVKLLKETISAKK